MLRVAGWLVLGAGCSVVLAYVAMQLPNQVRFLGLFSIAHGLATGLLLGILARHMRVHAVTVASTVAFIIGAAGIVVSTMLTFESYRDDIHASVKMAQERPVNPIAARMLTAQIPEDATPQEVEEYRQLKKAVTDSMQPMSDEELQRRTSLPSFLEHRISALGLQGTGALVVWLTEVIVAAIACCMIVRHFTKQMFCSKCDQWFLAVRTHLFEGGALNPVAETLGVSINRDSDDAPVSPSAIYVAIRKCQCEKTPPTATVLIRRGKKITEIESEQQLADCQKQLLAHIDHAQGL